MRLLLSAAVVGTLALTSFGATQASATENRITVNKVHKFVELTEDAINNSNMNVGRHVLDRSFDETAVFENRIAVRTPQTYMVRNNWYGTVAYNPYYNYPYAYYNTYTTGVNYQANTKWQQINLIEEKKRRIAGYNVDMNVTNVNLRPYGETAVVDVDIKEYSLVYAPHNPSLVQRVLHANSRCKAYLSQNKDRQLRLNRMDCNSNSTLPY